MTLQMGEGSTYEAPLTTGLIQMGAFHYSPIRSKVGKLTESVTSDTGETVSSLNNAQEAPAGNQPAYVHQTGDPFSRRTSMQQMLGYTKNQEEDVYQPKFQTCF